MHLQLPQRKYSAPRSIMLVTILASLPFLTFYWMSLSRAIPDSVLMQSPAWLTPLALVLYIPFALCAFAVLTHLWSYLVVACISLVLSSRALIQARTLFWRMVWLILFGATLAFPLCFRYTPALIATSPYRMHWVTDPGLLGGVVKAAHNLTDQPLCTYRLLGWSDTQQLYYQATCRADVQLWRVTPHQAPQPERVTVVPTTLRRIPVPHTLLITQVRAEGVRPPSAESTTMSLLIQGDGMVSPDGQWSALVSQYPFGTQDVLILTPQTE